MWWKLSCFPCRKTCRLASSEFRNCSKALGLIVLGLPHVRPLGEKLWEMRLTGRDGIGRVIYTAAAGRRLVVLHAFVKKTQKTPRKAMNLALKRLKELGS